MEVAQSVERLEQILAQFFDLSLEWGVRPVQLLLKKGLRVYAQKFVCHVFSVKISKPFL